MKIWAKLTRPVVLGIVAALGCEQPASVTLRKPPPSGGGPRDIAFSQDVNNKGTCIRIMATDGSNAVTVLCPDSGTPALWFPSWEPTGAAIAYRGVGNSNIYRVDVSPSGSGTNNRLLLTLTDCGGNCDQPKWSPLGDEIAVLNGGTTGTGPAVLIIPAVGCPFPGGGPCPQFLYSELAGYSFHGLAWSPDGTQLALTVSRGPVGLSPRFIVVVARATGVGTDVQQFGASTIDWGTGSRATVLALTVAPPGVTGAAPRDLYFFDVTTPLVPPQLAITNGRHPSFSPDGEFIAYQETSGQFSLVKREIDTGTRTMLQRTGIFADWR